MLYHIVGCSKGCMPYESKCIVYYASLSLFTNIYIYLLQWLVTCEDRYVILWAILKVECPMKVNALYIVNALTKVCIFLKRSVASQGHFNLLYNSTLKPYWLYLRHVPLFALLPQRQMTIKKAGNTSCFPTPWFTFNLPDDRQFVLGKSWEAELAS